MNVLYYRMLNGYGYYPYTGSSVSPGLGNAAQAGAVSLPMGNGLAGAAPTLAAGGLGGVMSPSLGGVNSMMPKWPMPGFSSTQIQYMFRPRPVRTKDTKPVKCDTCNITLNSEQQAKQHFSGKNHLKKVRQAAGGGDEKRKSSKGDEKSKKSDDDEKDQSDNGEAAPVENGVDTDTNVDGASDSDGVKTVVMESDKDETKGSSTESSSDNLTGDLSLKDETSSLTTNQTSSDDIPPLPPPPSSNTSSSSVICNSDTVVNGVVSEISETSTCATSSNHMKKGRVTTSSTSYASRRSRPSFTSSSSSSSSYFKPSMLASQFTASSLFPHQADSDRSLMTYGASNGHRGVLTPGTPRPVTTSPLTASHPPAVVDNFSPDAYSGATAAMLGYQEANVPAVYYNGNPFSLYASQQAALMSYQSVYCKQPLMGAAGEMLQQQAAVYQPASASSPFILPHLPHGEDTVDHSSSSSTTTSSLFASVPTNDDPVRKALMDNIMGKLSTTTTRKRRSDSASLTIETCELYSGGTGGQRDKRLKMISNGIDHHSEGSIRTQHASPSSASMSPWQEVPGYRSGWYHCKTCDISVTTTSQLQQHMTSLPHREKLGLGVDSWSTKKQTWMT